MTDKEIVERAKEAEKKTCFGKLVHSPISKGVNSAFGIGFIEGMVEYRNSLQEEPVSEIDFEQELYKYFGQVKDFTLGMRIARRFYEMGRNHQEPISEDLLKELKGIVNIRECVAQGVPVIKIARHFANWQKQQMMAEAVDAVVKIDAGGYPYVDRTIELYDYDNDIPLAKRGDKVKVIVIKED